MTSSAFHNFVDSVGLAQALVLNERRYRDPPTKNSEQKALSLRGGAAVLCVAAFESFLRDVFREQMSRLVDDPPVIDFTKLPDKVQVTSTWQSLTIAMRGPIGTQSDKLARLPDVTRTARLVGRSLILPEAFAVTNANPSADTVKEMFKSAGVSDVFAKARPGFDSRWPKAEAGSFLVDKLDEIVRRRHAVAHTVDVRRITRVELDESIQFLRALAESLDDLLASHVTGLLATCAPGP